MGPMGEGSGLNCGASAASIRTSCEGRASCSAPPRAVMMCSKKARLPPGPCYMQSKILNAATAGDAATFTALIIFLPKVSPAALALILLFAWLSACHGTPKRVSQPLCCLHIVPPAGVPHLRAGQLAVWRGAAALPQAGHAGALRRWVGGREGAWAGAVCTARGKQAGACCAGKRSCLLRHTH